MAYIFFRQLVFTSLHLSDGASTFQTVISEQENFVPRSQESEAEGEVFPVAREISENPVPTEISEKVQRSYNLLLFPWRW